MSAVKDLVIRAVSLAGQPLTHAMAARFDARGGTLGRSDSNTLVLPDPRRHISRLQAEVLLQGAHYVLRNAGNANPIAVNQTSLPPGACAPLAHGDEVQIGAYVLRVTLEDAHASSRTGTPATTAPTPAHTVIMASAAEPKTYPRRPSSQFGPSAFPGREGADAVSTVALGDLHAMLEPPTAAAACAEPVEAPPSMQAVPRTSADAADAPTARPPKAALEPARPEARDARDLWRAFEQGAGIDALPDEARTPELMAIVGRMLRASVDGTLRLMAARAATRQVPHAPITVVEPADNNPLRFTPDGQAAIQQLLRPPLRGFMPSTEALQDAMDDLLGHTVGTMAGMRAALQGVLAPFTPAQLEAGSSDPSMLDKLMPLNRHAKLWELYVAHHARLTAEAEDRFDNLFGAAFLEAYEAQLEALARARRSEGDDAAPPTDATLPPA